MNLRRELGADVCRILGLEPDRVTTLGFELGAHGVTLVRVELLLDDERAAQIAGLLLAAGER